MTTTTEFGSFLEDTYYVYETELEQFLKELEDIGITDMESFGDMFCGYQDGSYPEEDFVQELYEQSGQLAQYSDADMLANLVIDWQATWERNLRYNFTVVGKQRYILFQRITSDRPLALRSP